MMKKPFTFLVLLISLLMLVSCSNQTLYNTEKDIVVTEKKDIPVSFLPQELSIVSVGDSLTQGVGDSTGKGGYVPYLQNLLEETKGVNKADFINYGVRGNRSDQLLKRIKTEEVSESLKKADGVILTIGGNDIMKVVRKNFTNLQVDSFNEQLSDYERNLNEVLSIIRENNPNAVIILVGVYNPFIKMFSDIKEMNQIVADWNRTSEKVLAQYEHTYFVSIENIFENPTSDLLYEDYFHPNDQGYQLIAEAIYNKMLTAPLAEILENLQTEN
ncbi:MULTISPECIES: SGNH/GDSL hydrolase family protein [Bacillaceae]|jgi:lysophospholipase L1-like esterase|nr:MULTISPECIES: SGNH/GDSL hydrolase family protein [Bacillaceae]MCB5238856.1 SGNH/GDSL hydrolase family protein [Niallia circulans]MDU1846225.1 SGNH/GDSL hydrolase family protein [Niallia nealsonii]MED3792296.1 SGNH/GDSL hydrolase family protein [Niallia alba]